MTVGTGWLLTREVPAAISRGAIGSRVVGALWVSGGTMVGGIVFVESIESCRVSAISFTSYAFSEGSRVAAPVCQ